MSESELRLVVAELAERLVGQRVASAWQPARDHVLVGFSDGERLLFVPRGPDARVHTVRRRPRNPPQPFSFQGALRAHLRGPLRGIEVIGDDRVVELDFGPVRLHLRLTGRSGGLWLLREGVVLAAYDGPAPAQLAPLPERPVRDAPPRFHPTGDEGYDGAAARFFAARSRARREAELRVVVGRLLRAEVSRLARLLTNLEGDLERADRVDTMREAADTLAAHLHAVPRGADQVALPSLLEPDRVLTIPLRPDRPPSASLEALYGKARRLERMGERVLERLDATERALRDARQAVERLDDLELDALEALHERYRQRSPTPRHRNLRGIDTWVGPRGERVLVGKDAAANRRLSFQIGRGHDFWMHLRERPGAHLLLPMKRGQTPTLEHLLAAAQIAAHQAKLPPGAKVDVQYTRIRGIRSIPGSPGAQVRVHDEKVLHIERDPDALAGWGREDA